MLLINIEKAVIMRLKKIIGHEGNLISFKIMLCKKFNSNSILFENWRNVKSEQIAKHKQKIVLLIWNAKKSIIKRKVHQ